MGVVYCIPFERSGNEWVLCDRAALNVFVGHQYSIPDGIDRPVL